MTHGIGPQEWQPHRKLGRAGFATRFPHLFLVCFDWDEATRSPDDEEDGPAFRTSTISKEALDRLSARDLSRALIAPVVKTERNPYQWISLGRAANCDLVLPDISVSKLHATLELKGAREVLVTDQGSRNGSKHKGRLLDARKGVLARAGDELTFGRIPLQLMEPGAFFELL